MWINSVHGRHFVLVADERLRANDKITVWGRGWGSGETPTHNLFVTSPQSSTCHQYKMAPVNTVHRILRPPATQANTFIVETTQLVSQSDNNSRNYDLQLAAFNLLSSYT